MVFISEFGTHDCRGHVFIVFHLVDDGAYEVHFAPG